MLSIKSILKKNFVKFWCHTHSTSMFHLIQISPPKVKKENVRTLLTEKSVWVNKGMKTPKKVLMFNWKIIIVLKISLLWAIILKGNKNISNHSTDRTRGSYRTAFFRTKIGQLRDAQFFVFNRSHFLTNCYWFCDWKLQLVMLHWHTDESFWGYIIQPEH